MTIELLPADYVLCALAVVMAVTGLFRGFSGTIGFALGVAAAVFAGTFAWSLSATWTAVAWQRAGGTLVATLLAFGLVRLIVKKLVNGLLAQPTDALLGCLVGTLLAVGIVLGWAWSGAYLEHSALATTAAQYMGQAMPAAQTTTEGEN